MFNPKINRERRNGEKKAYSWHKENQATFRTENIFFFNKQLNKLIKKIKKCDCRINRAIFK